MAVALATIFVGCGDKISCDSEKTQELLKKQLLNDGGLISMEWVFKLPKGSASAVEPEITNIEEKNSVKKGKNCKAQVQFYIKDKPEIEKSEKREFFYSVAKNQEGEVQARLWGKID